MSFENDWALILGASSGFGGATGIELAKAGMNVFGVHLDRKATMQNVEQVRNEIKACGGQAVFFNINAAAADKRAAALDEMKKKLHADGRQSHVKLVLHSLAFGALKPFIPTEDTPETIQDNQMNLTLDVMANSLVYWVQDLFARGMLTRGSRIFAMTSMGSERVWATYGAVSAAKAALESHIRQLAYELAPHGITANSIRAGVTDTPALRKIPGNERMMEIAKDMNPHNRLTTTEDVAKAIVTLCSENTQWLSGNVINVDGGEFISG